MNKTLPITVILMFGLWIATYGVKQQVVGLEDRLTSIHKATYTTAESMQILQAEWSYLNNHSRLQALAMKYLNMVPCQGKQLVSFEQMEKLTLENTTPIRNVNYRK